eukprot:gene1989-2675_t
MEGLLNSFAYRTSSSLGGSSVESLTSISGCICIHKGSDPLFLIAVPSQYTSRSVWWTNHPKGSSGNFSKYVHGFPNGAKAVKASPETTILGDVSASYASFIMAEHLRLHHTFLSESATCRDQCRAGKAPAESSDKCPPKTTGPKYKFDHCFPEGQAAMAPIDFNVPALISTVYQPAKPPFVVMLLRNPTERLWAAFWTYGQFPGQYGKSNAGFLAYFEEQSAAWDKCVALHDVHTCGLRFETLAPEFEDVFYHGDQLLKGMYSIFVEDWVKWIGRDRVLVMRSEDYYEELGSGSGRPSALIKNEHAKVLEEHGEMPAEIRARVDAFYQPFKDGDPSHLYVVDANDLDVLGWETPFIDEDNICNVEAENDVDTITDSAMQKGDNSSVIMTPEWYYGADDNPLAITISKPPVPAIIPAEANNNLSGIVSHANTASYDNNNDAEHLQERHGAVGHSSLPDPSGITTSLNSNGAGISPISAEKLHLIHEAFLDLAGSFPSQDLLTFLEAGTGIDRLQITRIFLKSYASSEAAPSGRNSPHMTALQVIAITISVKCTRTMLVMAAMIARKSKTTGMPQDIEQQSAAPGRAPLGTPPAEDAHGAAGSSYTIGKYVACVLLEEYSLSTADGVDRLARGVRVGRVVQHIGASHHIDMCEDGCEDMHDFYYVRFPSSFSDRQVLRPCVDLKLDLCEEHRLACWDSLREVAANGEPRAMEALENDGKGPMEAETPLDDTALQVSHVPDYSRAIPLPATVDSLGNTSTGWRIKRKRA